MKHLGLTKTSVKVAMMAAAAGGLLSLVAPAASARSQGANAAGFRPTCLLENFGGVQNACGATETFAYPAPIDSTNTTYHVTVRAQGAGPSNTVSCWGHGVTEDGSTFYMSNTQALPSYGASADLAPLNVFVPTNGVMNIYCRALAGGIVWGYHF